MRIYFKLLFISPVCCFIFHLDPSKPSVLTVKPLTRDHPKIYFEVTKYEKTALVFDLSFIGIGVCLPKKAKMNSFR